MIDHFDDVMDHIEKNINGSLFTLAASFDIEEAFNNVTLFQNFMYTTYS